MKAAFGLSRNSAAHQAVAGFLVQITGKGYDADRCIRRQNVLGDKCEFVLTTHIDK